MREPSVLVRLGFLAAFVLPAGCSAPVDMTQNRGEETSSNYPAGPYGYIEGATVADYKFLGKSPTADGYEAMTRSLLLDEFHNDPATRLLLIEGSAGWCYFCNQEAPMVESLATEFAGEGFRAFTVLAEGSVRGAPSTVDDITSWVTKHDFRNTIMGIDPEARLFQYAPASAFPLHILIDTKNMSIEWLCVGGVGGCDTDAAVKDTLGRL